MATAALFDEVGNDVSGDRTRRLRRAMRHSRTVRLLRFLLPAGSLGLLGVYGLSVMSTAGVSTGLPKLDVGRIVNTDLKMSNPSYEGFGKDGSAYKFAAKSAQQELTNPTFVKLEGITGKLVQADRTETDVTATRGTFDNKASLLELFDGIEVVSQNGMKVKLPKATVQTKESLLTSQDPVVVEFPAGTINAVGLTLRQKAREVTFASQVVAHLVPAKASPAAADGKPVAAEPAAARAGLFGQSDAPLDVTSQRLDVKDATKQAIFTGSVRAVQGDSVIETPELTVGYGAEAATPGAPAAAAGPMSAVAGKVKDIRVKGPVVMTRGTSDRVTSNEAEFDAQAESGVLRGNVVMTSGVDRRATADRVDLDQKSETVVLSGGSVVVTQGKNELKGQRLVVNRKAATTQLTSPQSGRVSAVLYQTQKSGSPAKADQGASDTAEATGLASFKTDPSAPVKLDAHQLDVNDTAKVAVFSGDVVAVQGDFVMRTAEMHVNYTGEAGLADVAATGATAEKKASAQVSKIQAKRKVVITTKDGRTVNGDWADFDMKTNKVTVGGNVVLTQGQSQVQGTRLVIDMKSGQSTIDVDGSKVGASPDGGFRATTTGEGVKTNGGRPSAVFYPSEFKDKMKKPQP